MQTLGLELIKKKKRQVCRRGLSLICVYYALAKQVECSANQDSRSVELALEEDGESYREM